MSARPLPISAAPAQELPPPRAFGRAGADLDLDFGRTDRSALVTDLLACCCMETSAPIDARQNAAWNLPLGMRIVRLLRIVELTTESDALAITLRCPHAGCGKRLELSLHYRRLAAHAAPEDGAGKIVRFPLPNDSSLALRLPTGRDQAAWQSQSYATQHEALAAIARSLIVMPSDSTVALSPDQLAPLASAMEEADPLVAFSVNTTCPHCQQSAEIPADLEVLALQRLAQHQRALLREVHGLATRYGWTEGEVLAIPGWRRAEYLRLIAAGEEIFP